MISSANPGTLYNPSNSNPRFSISWTHASTTWGRRWLCALMRVVKSTPNTRLTSFLSGRQSLGICVLHCLWQSNEQSVYLKEKIKELYSSNTHSDATRPVENPMDLAKDKKIIHFFLKIYINVYKIEIKFKFLLFI